jgi:hypothetical protein
MLRTIVRIERTSGYVITNSAARPQRRTAPEAFAANPAPEIHLLNPEQIPASVHVPILA